MKILKVLDKFSLLFLLFCKKIKNKLFIINYVKDIQNKKSIE